MEINIDKMKLEDYIYKVGLGDIDALEKLYDLTRTYVYRYALSIIKNLSDAEDIMQDVYVNINRYANNYDPRNKPLAWILKITKNLCLNKIKSNKNKQTSDIDYELIASNDKDKAFNSVLLKNILESLNDEERQIIMLSSIENYKFREIANLMNLKLSTVLSKYNRTIKKLKKIYKDGEL